MTRWIREFTAMMLMWLGGNWCMASGELWGWWLLPMMAAWTVINTRLQGEPVEA